MRTAEQRKAHAERQRLWRKNNPALSKKKARERYRKNPEARRAAVQRWRERHPEKLAEIRRATTLKKYGMSLEEYNATLKAQDGKCAVCGSRNPGTASGVFPVDHCHKSKKVRGLLCRPCNIALGLFRDSPRVLKLAISYLLRSSSPSLRARTSR